MEGIVKPYKVLTGSIRPQAQITGRFSQPRVQSKAVEPDIVEKVVIPDPGVNYLTSVTVLPQVNLTNDTVDPEHLAEGYTAHNANYEPIVGTMQNPDAYIKEIEELNEDLDVIKKAFYDKGVEVGDTPYEEYGGLLDDNVSRWFQKLIDDKLPESKAYQLFYCYKGDWFPDIDTSKATNFTSCFSNTTSPTIPEYNVQNATNLNSYISGNNRIKKLPPLKSGKCYNFQYFAINSPNLEEVQEIDFSGVKNASGTMFAFNYLQNIVTFNLVGTLSASFDIRNATKLSLESLASIINALVDNSASETPIILYIGSKNCAKLTDELWKLAISKNWEIQ